MCACVCMNASDLLACPLWLLPLCGDRLANCHYRKLYQLLHLLYLPIPCLSFCHFHPCRLATLPKSCVWCFPTPLAPHGHRPTQPPTPIPSRPPTPVHFTKAHYVTDLHQVLSKKKGPTIGTENQQRLHQAWPSFSVFLKNCDSGNTYSFPFTLLFESSLSGQGPFAPDS